MLTLDKVFSPGNAQAGSATSPVVAAVAAISAPRAASLRWRKLDEVNESLAAALGLPLAGEGKPSGR